ncbi:MAG TPA: hypothetical protein DCW29_04540 [Janthinobacterium sp.]|nr:hypothetical protein [Janthinobacterium sp.]
MRTYTEREPAVVKELRAIAERGPGKLSLDPRFAPSLQCLRDTVKKGLTLAEMFSRIAAGTEKGMWEPWMAAFGLELRGVNYAQTGKRNACIAIDMRVGSKANAMFGKAFLPNWRSLVSEDCYALHIENADDVTSKAYAIFYLDPDPK